VSEVTISNYGYEAIITGDSKETFKQIEIWKIDYEKDTMVKVADYTGSGSFMELKEEVTETMKNNLSDLLDRCKISEEIK
jgi:hypothetical protein